ncbi:hypothetical protein CTI12_AA026850 [Artemisia annua]|uniref:Helitron helicase-like domain-containing protein n=1 Tax=Artemisia annua TaxID=35608 RepID=A0A2U1QI54_ARTAN|nr:hypothetical protein CTI12_AA026850 [Artemisia annua]
MAVESAQPSLPDDRPVGNSSVVMPDDGLVLSTAENDHLDTAATNMGGTFMPVPQIFGEGSFQSRVTAAPDTLLHGNGRLISHVVQHINSTDFSPVQIATADSSVPMFTSRNIGQQSFLPASQVAASQVAIIIMVLYADFSRAHILPNQEITLYSYNPGANGPETTPSGRRSRARAPLDYKSFGRCDQICQHCYALFWREEKKAGMPVSAVPQYQKCCAGGRVVLLLLFRTARDKLLEADIPDFQIRLFGVVGAQQYELPAGDTIGAIVYEGGPESATDYDIVIERHSREAENVNKLHPRYMALQFPLLFVYGEEGYYLSLALRHVEDSETQAQKKNDNEGLLCVPVV